MVLVTWLDDNRDAEHVSQIFEAAWIPENRWNGWLMPFFSGSEAKRMAESVSAMDGFDLYHYDAGRGEWEYCVPDDEPNKWYPVPFLDVNGVRFHQMGDGYTWQTVPKPNMTDWDDDDYAIENGEYDALISALAEAQKR